MTEQISKQQLLTEMEQGFEEFEILIRSLRPEQMTIPGVSGDWSIKDSIAHLSAWQIHARDSLQAQKEGRTYYHPLEGKSEDEQNKILYEASKDRSLDDVLNEFRTTYRQVYTLVQEMSEEDLQRPLESIGGNNQIARIIGNTYEHQREHMGYIQRWLDDQKQL